MQSYRLIASRYLLITLLAALSLFCFACIKENPKSCGDKDIEWTRNLALWRSKGILDYDMVIQQYRHGMYPHVPFQIKVRDSQNISMEPARENAGLERTDGYERVSTVEEMFATIKNVCETGENVRVEYDPEFGLPTNIDYADIEHRSNNRTSYKLVKWIPVAK